MLLLDVVHAAWARRGLEGIRYRAPPRRAAGSPFGESIPLEIEVWNRRRLPLAWLRADDEASPGVELRERELDEGEEPGTIVLRNAWTLRPWERVRRRFHVFAERRGVFTLGPVELSVGDPFARRVAAELRPGTDTFLVWPRTVPTTELEPPDRWGDLERAPRRPRARIRRGSRACARTRPATRSGGSTPGRARASARPVTKRFEPSRDREVLIALDVQVAEGAAWEAGWGDDDVESLYVVAASLARSLALRRVAFGILAAGYTGAETRIAACPSRPRRARRSGCSTCWRGCPRTRRCRSSGCWSWRPGRPARDHGPGAHGAGPAPLRAGAAAAGDGRVPTSCWSRAGGRPSRDAGRARQAGFAARRAVRGRALAQLAERLVIAR